MNDVDVILAVDADADRIAEHPMIRQRFRPERIDLEPRRLHRRVHLGRGGFLEQSLAESEHDKERKKGRTDI